MTDEFKKDYAWASAGVALIFIAMPGCWLVAIWMVDWRWFWTSLVVLFLGIFCTAMSNQFDKHYARKGIRK